MQAQVSGFDDVMRDVVGRLVGGGRVEPVVVGSRHGSIKLGGLSGKEDDGLVAVGEVEFHRELVQLRRRCGERGLELGQPAAEVCTRRVGPLADGT